jgi:glycosyltransferase involved in cell wall biosynthesis
MMDTYVLITPARNEADYIEYTIKSVLSQTVKPVKWIIVNDGSTDDTDRVVSKYLPTHSFMSLINIPPGNGRDFASKVKAIDLGFQDVRDSDFDFFGNLDADISFDALYYETLIAKFKNSQSLGIAGGLIVDFQDGTCNKYRFSADTVGCAVHFFRRQCYEQIGGYIPLAEGGEDTIAEIMAKMNKWQVKSFDDLTAYHHRPMGRGMWGSCGTQFHRGVADYFIGYHPLFFLVKALYRSKDNLSLFGSLLMLAGYLCAVASRKPLQVPPDVVSYLRQEQVAKLSHLLKSLGTKLPRHFLPHR